MAVNLTVNGVAYAFPQTGDQNWGDAVTNWATAVTNGMLQKAGGTFTLTAEVDFGATYGLKAAYFKSRATNPAGSGVVRLGSAEAVGFRNNANSADLLLTTDASDNLTFNGHIISSSSGLVPPADGGTGLDTSGSTGIPHISAGTWSVSSIVNADISNSAAIAYSKLALTGNIVNADINASAAIAYSKLSLTGSVVNADIGASAAIAYSKLNLATSIVNGDISASAAIAYSKLALTGSIVNNDLAAAVSIAKGGTGQTSQTAGFNALSPLTTKGDTVVHNGTNNVRQGIGSDGQVLVADSSQTNGLKWTTLSQGAKNYITYNNFENNATTGWSLAHSTLTSLIPTSTASAGTAFDSTHGGSAANGNLSIAASSSSPLAGTYSLSLASSSATTAGDLLISQAYTIDSEDQGKVMTGKFYYTPSSNPSNGNWSGTSSNSFAVYIYDVTNGAWIQPAGVYGMTQSTGIGYCTFTWQTPSNMTQFQVAIVFPNASAGAITVKFDDFSVGPQTAPYGPALTDWVSFTPTGSWSTNTTYTGYYRRVGDSLEVDVTVSTSGAPTAATLTINIPNGLSIDSTKLTSPTYYKLGSGVLRQTGQTPLYVRYNNATSVTITYPSVSGANIEPGNNVDSTHPAAFGAGNNLEVRFLVPIVGWSSNCQMSNDTDTRVVAFFAQGQPSSSISSSDNIIIYPTVTNDTHGAYNASTGVFTAPISGYYCFSAGARYAATFSAGNTSNIRFKKNGSSMKSTNLTAYGAIGTAEMAIELNSVYMNAGDTLSAYSACSGTTPSYNSNTDFFWFSGMRVCGPAVVAATESVYAKAYGSSTSVTNGGTVVLVFGTVEFDTHGAYATGTGKFTVPVSGTYECTCYFAASSATGTGAINNSETLRLQKNAADINHVGAFVAQETGTALTRVLWGTCMAKCVAGDTLNFAINNPDSTFAGVNNQAQTWVSFKRIGN